jgi:NAD(P)-dependent dehydrogenase (short-subunit alcohol dehydrogenase family)
VAIITGAGRGIGKAYASLLASRGASVVVNDLGSGLDGSGRDAGVAQAAADEIMAAGGTAIADGSDISSDAGVKQLVEAAITRFGRLDIVVNNAGILVWRDLEQEDLSNMESHLAVHLLGTFNVCRAAWRHLAAAQHGRIINTTSTAILGISDLISYGAAKGGVLGLSRALAVAGRPIGIGVNLVSPRARTRMERARPGPGVMEHRPPELVAGLVAFLAHESCPATGELYIAGGGKVARLFLGETEGYVKLGLSPEDIRENWAAINAVDRFQIHADGLAHSRAFLSSLTGHVNSAD